MTESARLRAKQEFGMQEVAIEYYNWTTINDMTPVVLKLKQLQPHRPSHRLWQRRRALLAAVA